MSNFKYFNINSILISELPTALAGGIKYRYRLALAKLKKHFG
jgi:hypothetical protein